MGLFCIAAFGVCFFFPLLFFFFKDRRDPNDHLTWNAPRRISSQSFPLLFYLPLSLRTWSSHNAHAVSLIITPNWHTVSFCLEPPSDIRPLGRREVGGNLWRFEGLRGPYCFRTQDGYEILKRRHLQDGGRGGSNAQCFTHDQANRKADKTCLH